MKNPGGPACPLQSQEPQDCWWQEALWARRWLEGCMQWRGCQRLRSDEGAGEEGKIWEIQGSPTRALGLREHLGSQLRGQEDSVDVVSVEFSHLGSCFQRPLSLGGWLVSALFLSPIILHLMANQLLLTSERKTYSERTEGLCRNTVAVVSPLSLHQKRPLVFCLFF